MRERETHTARERGNSGAARPTERAHAAPLGPCTRCAGTPTPTAPSPRSLLSPLLPFLSYTPAECGEVVGRAQHRWVQARDAQERQHPRHRHHHAAVRLRLRQRLSRVHALVSHEAISRVTTPRRSRARSSRPASSRLDSTHAKTTIQLELRLPSRVVERRPTRAGKGCQNRLPTCNTSTGGGGTRRAPIPPSPPGMQGANSR